jgi:hypothetical protein
MGGGCPYKKKYIQFNFIQYITKGLKAVSSDWDLGKKIAKNGRWEEGKKAIKQGSKKTLY